MKKSLVKNAIVCVLAVGVLLAVWAIAYFCVGNALIVPSISECFRAFLKLLLSSAFYKSFFATLIRVVFAFVLALVFAVLLAVLAYLFPYFAKFLTPIVATVRCVPVLAVLLILLVFSSAGVAPVIVAFLTLFPMLFTAFFTGLAGVDKELLEMSRVYKVSLKKQMKNLYLPAIARVGAREGIAAFSLGLKLVVSAEVLAQTAKSLGGQMQEAKAYLDMPYLFALVIGVVVLGLAIELFGAWLSGKVERWLQ